MYRTTTLPTDVFTGLLSVALAGAENAIAHRDREHLELFVVAVPNIVTAIGCTRGVIPAAAYHGYLRRLQQAHVEAEDILAEEN